MKKNILNLCGGGKEEHEISLITGKYLASQVDESKYEVFTVIIEKNNKWYLDGKEVSLTSKKHLVGENIDLEIHAAIPWLHGYPGETGHIPAYFELIQLPYLGCTSEGHQICFNKAVTKLWCQQGNIKITPFVTISNRDDYPLAHDFFIRYEGAFVKASNQGSSVGCYQVKNREDLNSILDEAFKLSPYVVVEKLVNIRELEISVFDYAGKTHVTRPCELITPDDDFYSYEEKYSDESKTTANVVANITQEQCQAIQEMALKAYRKLKLRHLCRMDFFLDKDNNEVYLNEINTYPGMTPISMFPKMMKEYGIDFKDFLAEHLDQLT